MVAEDFADFYRREYMPIVRVTFGVCGSLPIAEELAQEAFVRAYVRWHEVSLLERPGAWVRRAAINLATSRLRRVAAEARAVARAASGHRVVPPDWDTEQEEVVGILRHLSVRQRQAVTLHYIDDRSVEQTAEIMRCAPSTVKVLLHRARESARARRVEAKGNS